MGPRVVDAGEPLAAPATPDVAPLDLGVEDRATNAPLSDRTGDDALDLLHDVLAAEALLARDVLATARPGERHDEGTAAALRTVDDALAATNDRSPAAVHSPVTTALAGGGR